MVDAEKLLARIKEKALTDGGSDGYLLAEEEYANAYKYYRGLQIERCPNVSPNEGTLKVADALSKWICTLSLELLITSIFC